MKILIDMNLSPVWAEIFASHDMEAVHWSRVGAANATDSEIMEFAQVHGYTIFTHDLDFSAILGSPYFFTFLYGSCKNSEMTMEFPNNNSVSLVSTVPL